MRKQLHKDMEIKDDKKAEIIVNNGQVLSIRTSYIVEMHETLSVTIEGGDTINLDMRVSADFKGIPEEYHEMFIHMMSARYGGRVNLSADKKSPFDVEMPPPSKWWEIWKRIKI